MNEDESFCLLLFLLFDIVIVFFVGRAWRGGIGSGRLVVTSGSLQGVQWGSHEGAVVGGGGGGDPYSAHLLGEDDLLGHGSLRSCRPLLLVHLLLQLLPD